MIQNNSYNFLSLDSKLVDHYDFGDSWTQCIYHFQQLSSPLVVFSLSHQNIATITNRSCSNGYNICNESDWVYACVSRGRGREILLYVQIVYVLLLWSQICKSPWYVLVGLTFSFSNIRNRKCESKQRRQWYPAVHIQDSFSSEKKKTAPQNTNTS